MDHRSAASEFSLGLINSGMDKSGGLVFSNIQILTASSAMVKTMTPEVIPGAFYFLEAKTPEVIPERSIFPETKPRENRTLRGSPRES